MLKKVICSVFAVYQLSSGSSRILLQVPPIEPVTPPAQPIQTATPPVNPPPDPPIPVTPPQTEPPIITPPVAVPPVITPPVVTEPPVVPLPVPPVVTQPQIPPEPVPPVPPVNPPPQPQPLPPVQVPVEPVTPVTPPRPTEILPPAGYRFGAFGQLCPLTPASLFNKCQQPIDVVTEPDAVWCDRDADCCMCAAIECGPNCNRFYAGDSAAYGVANILVTGNPIGIGALIDCHGVEGCRGATIDGKNIVAVDCNGERSCQDATMHIVDPKAGFLVDCAGVEACDNLHIDIEFSGPPPNWMCDPSVQIKNIFQLSGIDCANSRACQNIKMSINNKGCDKVVLQNVECIQPGSCNGAVFDLKGDIDIQNCQCGPSCANAMGLAKCFQNLDRLLCPDPSACMGHKKEIVNPANGFELVCGNEISCKNAEFTIILNQDITKPQPITRFEAVILGGLNAGQGATFIFDNKQGLDPFTQIPIILELDRVECGGYGSCNGLTIITGENMFIGDFICASDACYNCLIKTNEADPGRPCDPSQVRPQIIEPPPSTPIVPVQPILPPNIVPVNPPQPVIPNPVIPVPQPQGPPPGMVPIPPQQPAIPVNPPIPPQQPIIPPVPGNPVNPPQPPVMPVPPVMPNPPAPQQPAVPGLPQLPQGPPPGMIPVTPQQPIIPAVPQQPTVPAPPQQQPQGPPPGMIPVVPAGPI